MEMTLNIELSGKQICDYLEERMNDMSEFDEFYKRERIIRIVCNHSTSEQEDIDAMKNLFSEIIEQEQKRHDDFYKTVL